MIVLSIADGGRVTIRKSFRQSREWWGTGVTNPSESPLVSTAAQASGTQWAQTLNAPGLAGTVNMQETQNQALKIVVGAGVLILTIWGGAVGLTSILDYYGFGPNTQTQQDRIEQNLRRLEGQSSDQPFQPNAKQ